MGFIFSKRSLDNLKGVHPDLIKIITRALAISPLDFSVIEGLRTVERQKALIKAGASRTMRSRHLTGHAVDLAVMVNGEIRWDWPLYDKLSHSVKRAALDTKIPLEWGGDWPQFRDGPHYQLPWEFYP